MVAGSLIDVVRHLQLWWVVGALCAVGAVIVWGIIKNK